jgi:predicted ATP-grasp superfamily ATP-dependent carboligase
MPGKPVSALLLGSGAEVQVLGLSEQWPSPAPGSPFRFSGVAAPAALEPQVAGRLGDAAARLATAAGVLGLASADFLHDEASGQHWLLELNPRPGASLEAFEMLFETSLLPLHLEGCAGLRPGQLPSAPERRAAATQIVYAPDDLRVPANFAWPDWTGDRGPLGTELPKGAPVCTVRAIAATTAAARAMVEGRSRRILAAIADEPIERWAAGQGVAIDTPSGSECTRNEGVR